MIPKIIHQVWVGPNVINPIYFKFQSTWKINHPTWEFRFWDDSNLSTLPFSLKTKEIINSPKNDILAAIVKSDLLRLEIIDLFGGLYADVDMESLKPFDSLFEANNFICGLESNRNIIGSALFACPPQNAIIKEIIQYIHISTKKGFPKSRKEYELISHPKIFTEIIKKYGVSPFPQAYFYPISWYERRENFQRPCPDSFTKHWNWGMLKNGWVKHYERLEKEI
jgi:mannosyltransferase OCH1-like enzyme